MKNVFEKRLDFNFNRYKKMTSEDLNNYEIELYNKVYKNFTNEEIIYAELEIIIEDLTNEMHNKKMNKEDLKKYIDYLKKIYSIKEYCELNNYDENELKKTITILQLSLNIKPTFITSLNMDSQIDLYENLEKYRLKPKKI